MRKQLALFASGAGSNVENIIRYFEHRSDVEVALIVCNKPDAKVLEIAKKYNIPSILISRTSFYQTENILNIFLIYDVNFVILAGFLWLVPLYLVKAFPNRIINIHPALLPKYGGKGMFGMNVHEAVFANKEAETGITIHYVNEHYDQGAILFQASTPLSPSDTPADIAHKVHQLEYTFFPKIIDEVELN
jgi:phosphoribosylglycinamide formyltransferase 1